MPVSKYSKNLKTAVSTPTGKLKKPETFVCSRCGEVFDRNAHRKEFTTVKSPLWENNENSKLPICNNCLKFYYNYYLNALGDPYSAYRRICMKFDIYYCKDIVDNILKNEQSADRVGAYISQLNYARYQGKTYDSTIEEELAEAEQPAEAHSDNVVSDTVSTPKQDAIYSDEEYNEWEEIFGGGFTTKEQNTMIKFYKTQKDHIPDQLFTTLEESVCDMARFKVLQARAVAQNEMKEITNYSNQFNKARKYVDDTVAKYRKNAAAEESNLLIGTLTDAIEQFCPADIYKNKGIFADVDGIGEKIRRFMARPMKNFFTGSREIDPEYNIDRNEV